MGGRDVKAVKVCVLHLGWSQRVRDEEGQDVDGQGPPQGHHHQPLRRAAGGDRRRVHPGALQDRGRQGWRCQVWHWCERDVILQTQWLPSVPNIGLLEDLLGYARCFHVLCTILRNFLKSPQDISESSPYLKPSLDQS